MTAIAGIFIAGGMLPSLAANCTFRGLDCVYSSGRPLRALYSRFYCCEDQGQLFRNRVARRAAANLQD